MKDIKKDFKIVSTMLIIVMLLFTTVSIAANDAIGISPSTTYKNVTVDTSSVTNIGSQIIKVVSTIGSIASVIVLVVLGIKYMIGSAEEKAEYKKTLLPYVIGAALVFAASAIANMVFTFASNFSAGS